MQRSLSRSCSRGLPWRSNGTSMSTARKENRLRRSFLKSKEHFVAKNEPVDIIGFYSEHHAGVFLTQFAPAIKEGSGMENAIHIHLVSRTSKAAGHIDDLVMGGGMVLRLPQR